MIIEGQNIIIHSDKMCKVHVIQKLFMKKMDELVLYMYEKDPDYIYIYINHIIVYFTKHFPKYLLKKTSIYL